MIKRQVERGKERAREKGGTRERERERPDGMTKRVIIVRLI